MNNLRHIYDNNFYRLQSDGSYRSAIHILDIVKRLINPKSVVDFGCGVGTWLMAAQEMGVEHTLGVDGAGGEAGLVIPKEYFLEMDFESDFIVPSYGFDIAISLEVAEHISASRSDYFIDQIVRAAPVVLFGAAIPSQGGVHHVNEQWQSHWMAKFEKRNYVGFDCIRPLVWEDDRIEWWYAQNTFLYIARTHLNEFLGVNGRCMSSDPFINVVHPKKWGSGRYIR